MINAQSAAVTGIILVIIQNMDTAGGKMTELRIIEMAIKPPLNFLFKKTDVLAVAHFQKNYVLNHSLKQKKPVRSYGLKIKS